ncbi:MAG: tetratricopeptide repeat protein [bacterium]|nr:tetratricopeptide repeat protein [bacterium]
MSETRGPSTAVVAVTLVAVIAMLGALGARQIWTADYWWQWKTGEYVSANGVPHEDVFSFTRKGQPRLELRWGYCLALFHVSEWFGRGSAVVLKCLAVVGTFLLAAAAVTRRRDVVTAGCVVAIAALAASQRFYLRPEVLSYLLVAAFLAGIERARRGPTRWLLALPLLQVLWVNVHGLFVFGIAIAGAWLTGELIEALIERVRGIDPDADRMRRLRAAALLVAVLPLVSLINPYFHRAVLLPLIQVGALHGSSMKEFYVELHSPFGFAQSYTALFWYKVLIGVALVSAALNWRRQVAFRVIVTAALFYLSATAVRNVPLFAVAAVPFCVANLSEGSWRDRLGRLRSVALVLLLVVCGYQTWSLATDRFHVRQNDTNRFGLSMAPHRHPVAATEFLELTGFDGRMFNSSLSGAYLLAHDFEVFIDPRGEIYRDGILDEYREIAEHPEALSAAVERYDLQGLFLETTMTRLIEHAHHHPRWRLVYADEVAVVFFRDDVLTGIPELTLDADWLSGVRRALPRGTTPSGLLARVESPAPYVRLARTSFVLDAHAAARELFEDARTVRPRAFDQYELLAQSAAELGDAASAAELFERAILRHPDRVDNYKLAARMNVLLQQNTRAAEQIEHYLGQRPDDADAVALHGLIDLRSRRFAEAEERFGRAIELDPRKSSYFFYRAQALVGLGRVDDAVASLERARTLAPDDPRVKSLQQRLGEP